MNKNAPYDEGREYMNRKILLMLAWCLLIGCGGKTAVSPTIIPQQQPVVPTIAQAVATAVSSTTPPTNTPIGNETAVPPTAAAPLSMETVVAQTRTAQDTSWVLRVNHVAGVQLRLPAEWELQTQRSFRYSGRDGAFHFKPFWWNEVITLAEACASEEVALFLEVPAFEREMGVINGRDVCFLRENQSETVRHAFVQYPEPWPRFFPVEGLYQFLMISSWSPTVPVPQVLETLEFPETPDAAAYLRGVVDEYQASYVFRDQVDFVAWEADALTRLTPNSTLAEAHQLIFEMFDMMRAATQHDHLSFYTPEQVQSQVLSSNRQRYGLHFTADNIIWLVEPGSPAAAAGFQVGDVLVALNGNPPAQATLLESENTFGFERNGRLQTITLAAANYPNLLSPNGRLLTDHIAYLETFGFNNQIDAELSRYLTLVHDQIAELDAPGRCWVLDLRRNTGGSKHALQGGIGPFAGNGPLYYEWLDANTNYPTMYEDGRIFNENIGVRDVAPERPYTMLDAGHRIAILVSEQTASGGELATLIVSTQPENATRIFGEQTAGFSSSVKFLELYDKSMVHVPGTAWMDLDGNRYPQGIIPDEPMDVLFDARYGTLDDPVVAAAIAWLENEQDCQ